MNAKRKLRSPVMVVNPKSYIYGDESLELAIASDRLAEKYDIDTVFTCQAADVYRIRQATKNIFVAAQFMDPIVPGRGMGAVLPESLKAAGADIVVLNHAEKPLTLFALDATIRRAEELGMLTFVCADTPAQCRAVAELGPDLVICEPTSLIGTGSTSSDDYVRDTIAAVKSVNPNIMVSQGAGVSTNEDVYRVIMMGSNATGATSGILNAPSREGKIEEMIQAIARAKEDLSK